METQRRRKENGKGKKSRKSNNREREELFMYAIDVVSREFAAKPRHHHHNHSATITANFVLPQLILQYMMWHVPLLSFQKGVSIRTTVFSMFSECVLRVLNETLFGVSAF